MQLFSVENGELTVEFPDIQGTDKQLPHAERKRLDFYFASQKLPDKFAIQLAEKLCIEKLDANFWMDNWNSKVAPMDFIRKFAKVGTATQKLARVISTENVQQVKCLMGDDPFLSLQDIALKMQISYPMVCHMYWLMTINNPILNQMIDWGLVTANFVQELRNLFPSASTNKDHAKRLFEFMPIVLQVYEESIADNTNQKINLLRWALAIAAKKHLKQEKGASKEAEVQSVVKNRKISAIEFNLVKDFIRSNPFSASNVTEIVNATGLDLQIVNAILYLLAINNHHLNEFAVQGTMDVAALHRLQSMFPDALNDKTDLDKLDAYIAKLRANRLENMQPEVQIVKPVPISVEAAKESKVADNPMEKLEAFIKANAVPEQYAQNLRDEVQKRLFSPERIQQLADKFLVEVAALA